MKLTRPSAPENMMAAGVFAQAEVYKFTAAAIGILGNCMC